MLSFMTLNMDLVMISDKKSNVIAAKNTVVSPDIMVWKFCGKAQFPCSFGRIPRNYSETVLFHKISQPGNYGYFLQCMMLRNVVFNVLERLYFRNYKLVS